MIGLILVTHGKLSFELQAALEHVAGKQEFIISLSIEAEDDIDSRRQDIFHAVSQLQNEDGIIILTDMFGGTPSNLAISVMEAGKIEVIAGVNLPMLIKLVECRSSHPIGEVIRLAQEAARKYIIVASETLP